MDTVDLIILEVLLNFIRIIPAYGSHQIDKIKYFVNLQSIKGKCTLQTWVFRAARKNLTWVSTVVVKLICMLPGAIQGGIMGARFRGNL